MILESDYPSLSLKILSTSGTFPSFQGGVLRRDDSVVYPPRRHQVYGHEVHQLAVGQGLPGGPRQEVRRPEVALHRRITIKRFVSKA